MSMRESDVDDDCNIDNYDCDEHDDDNDDDDDDNDDNSFMTTQVIITVTMSIINYFYE